MREILLMVLLTTVMGYAGGGTGFTALEIGTGARAAGMGEAFVASADDASGLFWNPAGSAWKRQRQVHFTYNSWIQGIHHNAASLTVPTTTGSFGIGLMLNSIDGFERRIIASEEPIGTFSVHDFCVLLHYARLVRKDLSFGVNFKYLNEKIYLDNANGYMVDLGVRYQSPLTGLFLAGALQNFGFAAKMAEETIRLPQTVRVGAAYHVPLQAVAVTVAGDFVRVIDKGSFLNLGIEAFVVPALALRFGYQAGYDDKNISGGFGIVMGPIFIDYAYVPFGSDLGDSHRFSLALDF